MIGSTFGPYLVLDKLGEGGMGEVFRARDPRLDRVVALKTLSAGRSDAAARARFDREARAIAALNHPNICAIYDVGVATRDPASTQTGVPYLVMELLEGETLQQRLTRGPLQIPQAVDVALALADALEAAHARGIVHRDLKPANVFITNRGVPKILDFGLAKAVVDAAYDVTRGADEALTELGTTVGTVAYMSPEQLRGEPLDMRSDLFSFGLVLYEMFTGQRAFAGPTSAVVGAGVLGADPPAPRSLRPEIPEKLEEIVLKALEKDRDLRCQRRRSSAPTWRDSGARAPRTRPAASRRSRRARHPAPSRLPRRFCRPVPHRRPRPRPRAGLLHHQRAGRAVRPAHCSRSAVWPCFSPAASGQARSGSHAPPSRPPRPLR